MRPRRLLYLSAHQMTAHLWRAGQLAGEGTFAATEAGCRQFTEYLRRNTQSTFSLLVNVAQESFQIESIPYLRGADRQAVIERKLSQLFFNATLTASQSLGYEKSRRKDERLLLAALPDNAFFAPWLKAIADSGADLAGIHSLPLLAAALLKKLAIADGHCLLLTIQDQSIRQSYYADGQLHFSRLTPLQNSGIAGIAQSLSVEAAKLQQYLASQRMIGPGDAIAAHILAHRNALGIIRDSCVDSETLSYHLLDIEECAKKIGLKAALADSHAEGIFLHLLATAPTPMQFADDGLRHNHHLNQTRSLLHGSGAVALLGCLLLAADMGFDAHSIRRETSSLRSETARFRQLHEDLARTFPQLATDHETLQRVVRRYRELDAGNTSPEAMYAAISQALQHAPAVDLEGIDWSDGQRKAGEAGAGGPPPPSPADARGRAVNGESAVVRGTLRLGASASPRQALGALDQFVAALSAEPQLRVIVLERPVDIDSGKSLSGGDALHDERKAHAFSLLIERKAGA